LNVRAWGTRRGVKVQSRLKKKRLGKEAYRASSLGKKRRRAREVQYKQTRGGREHKSSRDNVSGGGRRPRGKNEETRTGRLQVSTKLSSVVAKCQPFLRGGEGGECRRTSSGKLRRIRNESTVVWLNVGHRREKGGGEFITSILWTQKEDYREHTGTSRKWREGSKHHRHGEAAGRSTLIQATNGEKKTTCNRSLTNRTTGEREVGEPVATAEKVNPRQLHGRGGNNLIRTERLRLTITVYGGRRFSREQTGM